LDQAVFGHFLDMEWAQNATIRSSIGAPNIVRHDVIHTVIILKLETHVD